MGTMKSFSDVLISAPPKPNEKPSPWEAYLLSIIQNLQKDNALLHQQIQQLQKDLANATTEGTSLPTNTSTLIHQEVSNAVQTKHAETKQSIIKEVISTIDEEEQIATKRKQIRVGGLPAGWQTVEVEDSEDLAYTTEQEEHMKRVTKAIPFVDIGDPLVYIKGNQIVLSYSEMHEKIKVMRQAKSLQGTSVWMADELTQQQLKHRKRELAKVKEARAQGKWAVYRGGKAIVEDFRQPKKPTSPNPSFPPTP